MMKKILCLVLVLTVCAVLPAAAETAQPVTAEELDALLTEVRAKALTEEVLNDPSDEAAQNEDGTLFWFEDAKIYTAGEAFTADTPVNALVIDHSEEAVFRGVWVASLQEEALALRFCAPEFYMIGDCLGAKNIANATAQAHDVACNLGRI